jgi:ATP synthase protein I
LDSKDERTKNTDLDSKIRDAGRRLSARTGLLDSFGTAGMMGFHLLSGMLVGGFIGYWLDEWLDTGPWLKAVFFIIGIAAGFRNIYLDAQRLVREQDGRDKARKRAENKDAPGPHAGKKD